jgi:OPA family glycerol-3-phosphate transporter-like MFS transporter
MGERRPAGRHALGALASGWISDRFCGSRRSGVIVSHGACRRWRDRDVPAAARHALSLPLLFLCGFFAYGPQSTFWALAPDLLGRERTGTAVGVMNFFAYLMAGLGRAADRLDNSAQSIWRHSRGREHRAVFSLVAIFATCSAAVASLIRR